jgi:hypothetical protein
MDSVNILTADLCLGSNRDAVSQVTDRGYSVKEVSGRLGVSTKSLYDWIKHYQKPEVGTFFLKIDSLLSLSVPLRLP